MDAEEIKLVEYASDPNNAVKLQEAFYQLLETEDDDVMVILVRTCSDHEHLLHPTAIAMALYDDDDYVKDTYEDYDGCKNWLPVFVGQWPACDKVIRDLMNDTSVKE